MSRKVCLYVACSIDGYIARKNHSLDWLDAIPGVNEIDHGYNDFIESISSLIMGASTYREVIGFGVEWPYEQETFVVTNDSKLEIKSPRTQLIRGDDLLPFLNKLKEGEGKDIWLVGGGVLTKSVMGMDMLDKMVINLIPTVLGDGIPLFPEGTKEARFKLTDQKAYPTGIINLYYERIESN